MGTPVGAGAQFAPSFRLESIIGGASQIPSTTWRTLAGSVMINTDAPLAVMWLCRSFSVKPLARTLLESNPSPYWISSTISSRDKSVSKESLKAFHRAGNCRNRFVLRA